MSELTQRIRAIIATIPPGRVATYGQIAARAGNPRAARAVVWVLRNGNAAEGAPPLPWHRVISSQGRISQRRGDGFELQQALLRDEGVSVDGEGRVSLGEFAWDGSPTVAD